MNLNNQSTKRDEAKNTHEVNPGVSTPNAYQQTEIVRRKRKTRTAALVATSRDIIKPRRERARVDLHACQHLFIHDAM